uniref:Putative DSS1/SEM1 family n=1 Tax=Davidia involucrata TaxID=16924 RepID=A0A5B6YWI1_DAVIN
MEKEAKVATEDPKIDLFEDDDEFEEFEINEEWDEKEGKETTGNWRTTLRRAKCGCRHLPLSLYHLAMTLINNWWVTESQCFKYIPYMWLKVYYFLSETSSNDFNHKHVT